MSASDEVEGAGLLAAGLSLLCPGLGHVYVGRFWRGLAFFVGWWVVWVVPVPIAQQLAVLAFYVWVAYDARRCGLTARPAKISWWRVGGALAVLGLLVALIVARPLLSLLRFGGEGAMKGNLGSLRQAVQEYKDAHGGEAPASLDAALKAGGLTAVPSLWYVRAPHEETRAVDVVADTAPADTGRWAYVVSASSPALTGTVFINCTHTDAKGSVWATY